MIRHHGAVQWINDAEVAFPDTVQDIIRARIDRLEDPVKRTVQTAAVIGREFSSRLLTQLSERAVEVQHHLETLKQIELIHETQVFPEWIYRFKHAVIQDVAYESLLGQRRQALHGAIGAAIEELYADRLEEQAAILAYHYARSTYQAKAIPYTLLAGDQAARLHARAEATIYYNQALTMARALPASSEGQRAQIDAILKLAAVGATHEDLARDQENLEQARVLAEGLEDASRLAQICYWQGRIYYVRGDFQAAITYAQQSLAIADQLGAETLAAPPVNLLGRSAFMLSDYVQTSQLMARSAEQMRQLGNVIEEATASAFAGIAFGFLGEFTPALTYVDHGLHLAQELQNPFAEAAAYHYRANIQDQRGAWAQVISDCMEARRIAEQTGDLFRVYIVKIFEGQAHTMAGNPGQGRMILEESLTLAAQLGTTFGLSWAKAYLAACLLALGEYEVTPSLCHEAIQLAEETGHKFSRALAYRTLAEVLAVLNPADTQAAERAIREAIRGQQEMSNNPELARSYVSYARLLQSWGKVAQAREYLTQAIGMFQQMGMTWDCTRAEELLHAIS